VFALELSSTTTSHTTALTWRTRGIWNGLTGFSILWQQPTIRSSGNWPDHNRKSTYSRQTRSWLPSCVVHGLFTLGTLLCRKLAAKYFWTNATIQNLVIFRSFEHLSHIVAFKLHDDFLVRMSCLICLNFGSCEMWSTCLIQDILTDKTWLNIDLEFQLADWV